MAVLTKTSAVAIKTVSDGGLFEGYGSVFGNVDLGGDVCVKGCYARTIAERGARGIKMLHEHNPACPIGVWEEIKEDDRGLYCRGRLLVDALEKAREVYALMKEGVLEGLSIGYRVVKSSYGAKGERLLEDLDLREISAVMFAMNEAAVVTAVKVGRLPTEREFEAWLTQDAGLTRSQARTIIARGFKALKTMPGAGAEGTSESIDWSAFEREAEAFRASIHD